MRRRQIGDFEEKRFIREILGPLARTASLGEFDDCVIVDLSTILGIEGLPNLVYSLDHPSFVRHPGLGIDPFRFYGRWVAAVTCNDVVAMGARCRGFSLDLAAPLDMLVDEVRSFMRGLTEVLSRYGATYEGGNLDTNVLETVGFCWGLVDREAMVRRSGAVPGDVVAVTGVLGQGWTEYQVRKNGLEEALPAEVAEKLRVYKEMPVAAHEPIAKGAEACCFSSGMDLSDGLVEFLHTICERAPGLGVSVDAERLPITAEVRIAASALARLEGAPRRLESSPELIALEPGYDSPFVHGFTVRPEKLDEALEIFESEGSRLVPIGTVDETPGPRLSFRGSEVDVPSFWDDQCRQRDKLLDWFDFLRAILGSS